MELFGRYQLLRRVALGGMAEIFLARSASIDGFAKNLVIKRIRGEYSNDMLFSSRFLDEARISMTLNHQNIVQVFDFGQVEGSYYLAMEHVHGCDLESVMNLDGVLGHGLDPALSLFIMREVCRGLDYAHTRVGRRGEPLDLIHRDVSPHNILVSVSGEVKLTDFGIAQARGQSSTTTPGVVLGKLGYMSPEHATGQAVDVRSDIFSAGLVLWELLTGDRPFPMSDPPDLIRAIREADIERPSKRNKKLAGKLDELVMRALAADPDQRYQSAREMADALHSHLAHKHAEVSGYTLQAFLRAHAGELEVIAFEETEELPQVPLPRAVPQPPPHVRDTRVLTPQAQAALARTTGPAPEAKPSPPPGFTPDLIRVVELFRSEPSLWLLVRMGDLCVESGQLGAAVAMFRTAAMKFAQRGLLAQALLCCRRALDHGGPALRAEIVTVPTWVGRSDQDVSVPLNGPRGSLEDLVRELLAQGTPSAGVIGEGTPLLAYLDGEAFAELAESAPLRKLAVDSRLIEQGTSGRTMFLIATGRVLVYATNAEGKRVYLSSFSAGDFVGENGFFTGSPRSATVEAIYPTEVFEIDQALFDRVMSGRPQASNILLRFYKERIVDAVLAKSPTFGLLPHEARRAVRDKFELERFPAGAVVIREGEKSDQIYLIKDGQADVVTQKNGEAKTLSTLGPCQLFGEVAALRGIPRTASVVARTPLEALRLAGTHFQAVLDQKPEVRKRVLDEVARRARENIDRLVTFTPAS